jgi:hypothetical protein
MSKTDRAHEVAMDLLGTCQSLDFYATQEEQADKEFCDALDAEVMECTLCGWWFETNEMITDGDEPKCKDCSETEGER